MTLPVFPLVSAALLGLGATLILDLWSLFLWRAFRIPASNLCLVGRWIRTMPDGTFRHASIASASPKSAECTVGWIAHYLIGIAFAIAFIAVAGSDWLQRPTPRPAVLFGAVTVLLPFFIMQPAFGLGFAASRVADPGQARLRSLMNHIAFGLGLYLSGLLVRWFVQVFF
jgi:hypothetical protein